MGSTRRRLLRTAGTLLGAFGVDTLGLSRALAQPAPRQKTLVALFLRGGVDGLSMVPPVGDPAYAALRPTLRLLPPSASGDDAALRLDSTFGLHPALAPLLPLFSAGKLAVVHAVGQQRPSRSHFDAQDFLESGTPGRRASSGWLNRALAALPASSSPLRAVAVQNGLPLALQGEQPALAFASLKQFRVAAGATPGAAQDFEALYAGAVDDALKGAASDAFQTLAELQGQGLASAPPHHGARYPPGPLGQRLADLARLIHAGLGVQVAATEAGGFDTHLGQGAGKGQLSLRLKDLGAALAAFAEDLGERLDDVCLVTMTEFGRTARENGTRGTDHGTASACFVLGGGVRGGRVHADWPGLAAPQLYEGRDLRATTDVRSVLAAALSQHLRLGALGPVFPDGAPRELALFGT